MSVMIHKPPEREALWVQANREKLVAPHRQAAMPSTSNAMSRKYRVPIFFSSFCLLCFEV
jgi:hypothetical protein